MTVYVESVRSFTIPVPPADGALSLDPGATVAAAYRTLGIPEDYPRPPRPFVNGERASMADQLSDQDRLFLFYPLSGG